MDGADRATLRETSDTVAASYDTARPEDPAALCLLWRHGERAGTALIEGFLAQTGLTLESQPP